MKSVGSCPVGLAVIVTNENFCQIKCWRHFALRPLLNYHSLVQQSLSPKYEVPRIGEEDKFFEKLKQNKTETVAGKGMPVPKQKPGTEKRKPSKTLRQ